MLRYGNTVIFSVAEFVELCYNIGKNVELLLLTKKGGIQCKPNTPHQVLDYRNSSASSSQESS